MQERQHLIKDQRIYFSLLQRVGSYGHYQKTALAIFCFVCLISSCTFFVNPFIFYQDPYVCQDKNQNCQQYVCSLPQSQRAAFLLKPSILTLSNYFGDMHCEGMNTVTAMQSAILLGAFLGIFIALLFTQYLGRKLTVCYSIGITLIGLLVTLMVPDPSIICIGLFLWGAGSQISYTMMFPFITEIVEEHHRSKFYVYLLIFFGIGAMGNSFLFYVIGSWREVLLFGYILPHLIALLFFQHFMEDTPIELISKYKAQQAYNAFIRISQHNEITNHGITLQQIDQLQTEYRLNQQKKHNYKFTVFDLFKFSSVRGDIIKLSIFVFIVFFVMYSPALLLDQLNMNIFYEGVSNGIAQLVTIPFLISFVTTQPRKSGQVYMMSASFIFAAIVTVLSPQMTIKEGNSFKSIITMIFFFCFRFFANMSSNFFANSLNETFPAQVRTLGVYFVIAVGRSSSLLIPFLYKLRDSFQISLMFMFTIATILGIISAFSLKETIGTPPSELLEELQLKEHHYKYHKIQN